MIRRMKIIRVYIWFEYMGEKIIISGTIFMFVVYFVSLFIKE